jgi:hypothetical protein
MTQLGVIDERLGKPRLGGPQTHTAQKANVGMCSEHGQPPVQTNGEACSALRSRSVRTIEFGYPAAASRDAAYSRRR